MLEYQTKFFKRSFDVDKMSTKMINSYVWRKLWTVHNWVRFGFCVVCFNYATRRYPWGTQRLVYTYSGRVYSWQLKTQSPKSWPNFHFSRGGRAVLAKTGYSWQKILQAQARSCTTDSLFHTSLRVETKKSLNDGPIVFLSKSSFLHVRGIRRSEGPGHPDF